MPSSLPACRRARSAVRKCRCRRTPAIPMRMCSDRADRFPYADDRSYTPPDAPLEKYLGMLDAHRLCARRAGAGQRAWPRQFGDAGCVEAPANAAARRRGGGCRHFAGYFTRVERARRPRPALQPFLPRRPVALPRRRAARRQPRSLRRVMAELGWHLQLWIDVKDLPQTIPVLKSFGLPVVIDHMGRTDARAGTGYRRLSEPAARSRRRLVLGKAVRRASPQPASARLSRCAAVPRSVGEGQSGTRWSGAATGRIRASRARCPTPGTCSNCSRLWTPDQATQQRILVTNPAKLYGFPN